MGMSMLENCYLLQIVITKNCLGVYDKLNLTLQQSLFSYVKLIWLNNISTAQDVRLNVDIAWVLRDQQKQRHSR